MGTIKEIEKEELAVLTYRTLTVHPEPCEVNAVRCWGVAVSNALDGLEFQVVEGPDGSLRVPN
jgi:hypothetical protein